MTRPEPAVPEQAVPERAVPEQAVPERAVPEPEGPDRDHRKRPRRRGVVLHQAIFEAVRAEIAESGYAALTMDRVAVRARTSKATLYRHWPGRAALVLDAAYDAMPGPGTVPDTGSLRLDLLTVLRQAGRLFEGPLGQAVRGVLGEAILSPDVDAEIRDFARGNASSVTRVLLARAAARGECDAALVTEIRIEAGPALLRQRFLLGSGPVDDEFLVGVVDQVMLPLFGVHR